MYLLEYSIDKDSYEIVKIDTKQNLEFVNSRCNQWRGFNNLYRI